MIQHPSTQAGSKMKSYFLSLLTGTLPALAFLLLITDQPTDVLEIFTGTSIPELYDRPLKIPFVLFVLCLFFWASFRMNKTGKVTIGEQCGLVFIATLIIAVWLWISILKVAQALTGMGSM